MLRSLHTFAAAAGACAALAVSQVALADEPNTLSEAEKKAGWKLLFDGKSADNFRDYQKDSLNSAWVVKDGAIQKTDKASNMITKEKYGSFELSLEYRISAGGNSGL